MLLKGKTAGGMAPPFLQIGASSDSEEEMKRPSISGLTPTKAIAVDSIDSDDDGMLCLKFNILYRMRLKKVHPGGFTLRFS